MNLIEFFTDYTYRTVFIGTTLTGVFAGALGTFAYLRKQSLIGDVVAHSALPGALGAFILAVSVLGIDGRSMALLTAGAVLTGTAAVGCFRLIDGASKLSTDTSMAIVLTTFFGAGLLLLRLISNGDYPGKGGIHDYLFGNASVLTRNDIHTIAIVGAVVLTVVLLFWKEFTLRSWDSEASQVMGYSGRVIDTIMFASLAFAIVIGVKSVGVVLMVAFVVTPPAAARQWVKTMPAMVALSAFIGGLGSAMGAYISIAYAEIPTGPAIVLTLFAVFVLSLLAAPGRSIINSVVTRSRLRRRLVAELNESSEVQPS